MGCRSAWHRAQWLVNISNNNLQPVTELRGAVRFVELDLSTTTIFSTALKEDLFWVGYRLAGSVPVAAGAVPAWSLLLQIVGCRGLSLRRHRPPPLVATLPHGASQLGGSLSSAATYRAAIYNKS